MNGANHSPRPRVCDENAAAAYLGMSRSWISKTRLTGKGPKFIKVGGAVRYRYEDLDAYLEQQERISTSKDAA